MTRIDFAISSYGSFREDKIRVQDCELFEKKYYIVIFLPCAKMKLSEFFLMSGLFIVKPFRD
jgi:hypothetical protein